MWKAVSIATVALIGAYRLTVYFVRKANGKRERLARAYYDYGAS